jgi:RHS repeat-associated protein
LESRYTLYSPELTLLAETATSAATPPIAYEYVWFGGQPLAQVENATGNTRWYFNDHLGTPLALTDTNARLVWQAEYEPYGTIYAIRRGGEETIHQPLRLPGQTAEEGSDLYQNVFRWYRAGWGRYTQTDPDRDVARFHPYDYANGNPPRWTDPRGLKVFNMFEVPPNIPPMPGPIPDKSCCSQKEIQKMTDRVDYQIDRMLHGSVPFGKVVAATISPIVCRNGLCSNWPVDPKDYQFVNNYAKIRV